MDLNAENDVEVAKEKKEEYRPTSRRTMSGMSMVGLGRRDVWRPLGLGLNLAIKAQRPPAPDITSFRPDEEKEEEV